MSARQGRGRQTSMRREEGREKREKKKGGGGEEWRKRTHVHQQRGKEEEIYE